MMISLDYDDYQPMNHRWDMIDQLRVRFDDFKVTMFTIPWDIRFLPEKKGIQITDKEWKPWVEKTKEAVEEGWMEVAIHGLTHLPLEFSELSYQEAKNRILVAQKMFFNVGIKTNGMFKAPNWAISDGARQAVEDLGLKLMEDGYYNWNLKDKRPDKRVNLIAHGHIQDGDGCNNGIEETYMKLADLPHDIKWKHLREVIK